MLRLPSVPFGHSAIALAGRAGVNNIESLEVLKPAFRFHNIQLNKGKWVIRLRVYIYTYYAVLLRIAKIEGLYIAHRRATCPTE